MTGYLQRASIARNLKAVTKSRPPHAGLIGDVPELPDAALAPPPGVIEAAGRAEAEWKAFA